MATRTQTVNTYDLFQFEGPYSKKIFTAGIRQTSGFDGKEQFSLSLNGDVIDPILVDSTHRSFKDEMTILDRVRTEIRDENGRPTFDLVNLSDDNSILLQDILTGYYFAAVFFAGADVTKHAGCLSLGSNMDEFKTFEKPGLRILPAQSNPIAQFLFLYNHQGRDLFELNPVATKMDAVHRVDWDMLLTELISIFMVKGRFAGVMIRGASAEPEALKLAQDISGSIGYRVMYSCFSDCAYAARCHVAFINKIFSNKKYAAMISKLRVKSGDTYSFGINDFSMAVVAPRPRLSLRSKNTSAISATDFVFDLDQLDG